LRRAIELRTLFVGLGRKEFEADGRHRRGSGEAVRGSIYLCFAMKRYNMRNVLAPCLPSPPGEIALRCGNRLVAVLAIGLRPGAVPPCVRRGEVPRAGQPRQRIIEAERVVVRVQPLLQDLRPWCARCPWLRAHSVDVPLQAHTTLADRVTGRGEVDRQAQRVPPGHLDDVDAAARGELHVGPRAGVHFEDAELAVTRIALEL